MQQTPLRESTTPCRFSFLRDSCLDSRPCGAFSHKLVSVSWTIQVYNYLAGVKIQEKKFDVGTERRIWEMTYLDRDFRVLYGRKEDMASEEGFIFILEREKD